MPNNLIKEESKRELARKILFIDIDNLKYLNPFALSDSDIGIEHRITLDSYPLVGEHIDIYKKRYLVKDVVHKYSRNRGHLTYVMLTCEGCIPPGEFQIP